MSKDLAKNIGELNGSVKSYVQAKVDLAKLTLLEKVSRSISYLFNMIVVTLLFSLVIGFGAAAFAVWYGQTYHNYFEGVLIAGGFLIIVAVGFLLFRKKIVTNSVISNFSEILFEEDEQEKES
ncbi:Putative Holin-X, holin superfamily III [Tangfeifania diversioriginum]|uniref:Putative Holin-X, holin superfamily III n=1 Tax=Tangfeifania diversioriginum TaxID=1168035 RepID=A0A1M6I5E2_9BACT|nr:phage holin family protein [Tangfeifania diversioriginum]SHJ29604.1 Putative Holin-X, holin superfamily III [Tangfeifania diversioriginum]